MNINHIISEFKYMYVHVNNMFEFISTEEISDFIILKNTDKVFNEIFFNVRKPTLSFVFL